jgi:DNA-binding CsgD family transcriptional regulator
MTAFIGTQMHWLTLALLLLESYLFAVQLFHFLNRPRDRQRLWYLILLGLLITFNIANGLLPDPSFHLDIKVQNMIAYGAAYLAGAYFPFYFYKAYGLKELRFHATWGVSLFAFVPYVVFDIVIYAINGRLIPDRELGVLIPGAYGLLVLAVMLRAIIGKYKTTGKLRQYRCELAIWLAVIPWETMSVFAFYPAPQWLRIGSAILSWLAITVPQFRSAIRFSWYEDKKLKGLELHIDKAQLVAACKARELSKRIADVTWLWVQGYSKQAIADALFITKDTVKSHISNLYKTMEVSSQ